jgi:hypothetical protein
METPEVEEGAYRLFDSAGRQAVLGTEHWDVRSPPSSRSWRRRG